MASVIVSKKRAIVSGLNLATVHRKPDRQNNKPGEIVKVEKPIDLSNLSLIDSDGSLVKVGFKEVDGKKVRINKKTGATIEGGK